jgi:GT2 family glycosyltransferase
VTAPAVPPRVTAVLLNWNGWSDTLTCLASLDALESPDLGVIVVDNASTDDSVDRLLAARPGLELIRSGVNRGFGGGNNIGIRRALERGAAYVWLLNTDATVRPDTLRELVAVAEADAHVGAVGAVILDATAPHRVQAWGGGLVNAWTGVSRHVTAPSDRLDYLMAACVLLRAAALEQVGGFDERFFYTWEDTDLSARLVRARWRLAVAPGAFVYHREASSVGATSPVRARHYSTGQVLFARKHAPVPLLTAAASALERTVRALGRGRWQAVGAIWRGWLEGWRR